MAQAVLQRGRDAFASGKTLPLAFRRQQLKNLLKMYDECREEILDAVYSDLRKAKLEGSLYEIEVLKADINSILQNLDEWATSENLPFNLLAFTDKAYVHKDPFGVVLILGTWNYPFAMALQPLAGAIGAGNCAVIKPSEMSPKSSATIARIVPRYLDKDCYQVFEGDVNQTIDLLTHKFDYIFATGSINVGKSVMAAAAKNLTPVTLELGGKSPVYIDDTADIDIAAKRILWGKCMNLGQTCIAPDYILLSSKRKQAFLDACAKVLADWYGKNAQENKDLTRIVNERHFLRLKKILDNTKGRIAIGGKTDQKDLWISPTIVVDLDPKTDSTMEDEIFGPILPVITVESPSAAMKFILERPKPLALYVFSEDETVINKFVNETSSGGVCCNDVIWQCGWEGLPFGGVGNSGMGRYHGKYSMDTFCHKKAVLHRGMSAISEKMGEMRYPPYKDSSIKMFSFVLRLFGSFNMTFGRFTTHTAATLIGALLVFAYFTCCTN